MSTIQDLYNKICDSLRTNGNPYGSSTSRGWGWSNPYHPEQRCAIARFTEGNTSTDIMANLYNEYGMGHSYDDWHQINGLVFETTHLYDLYPSNCNNKKILEKHLQLFADIFKLHYQAPTETIIDSYPALVELTQEVLEEVV